MQANIYGVVSKETLISAGTYAGATDGSSVNIKPYMGQGILDVEVGPVKSGTANSSGTLIIESSGTTNYSASWTAITNGTVCFWGPAGLTDQTYPISLDSAKANLRARVTSPGAPVHAINVSLLGVKKEI